jgi:hypothetical protein
MDHRGPFLVITTSEPVNHAALRLVGLMMRVKAGNPELDIEGIVNSEVFFQEELDQPDQNWRRR